ncbi:UNVERIFIED_CONTAM: hypothetical protein HDU68_002627 [Siphonaria sp. JEL0065]|nr:hypothetical protein HDU68_002627 [Siphonaria sp. JEL0065]
MKVTINKIPPEISCRFLLGFDPLMIKQLRMLCKTFYLATSTASFAQENLKYPITGPKYGLRDCHLTKDFLYWDRLHQIEFTKVKVKRIYFPSIDQEGGWSVLTMDFSLPPNEDPSTRVHAVLLEFVQKPARRLGRLEFLRTLDLSDNMLGGDIPDAVFSLFRMGKLILARNRLTGSLNVQCLLWNLSQNCLLGTIPAELGCLKELKVLNLSQNAHVVKVHPVSDVANAKYKSGQTKSPDFYLWLDYLCTNQRDDYEIREATMKMVWVYGTAFATIVVLEDDLGHHNPQFWSNRVRAMQEEILSRELVFYNRNGKDM